jgi:hypothetical protein
MHAVTTKTRRAPRVPPQPVRRFFGAHAYKALHSSPRAPTPPRYTALLKAASEPGGVVQKLRNNMPLRRWEKPTGKDGLLSMMKGYFAAGQVLTPEHAANGNQSRQNRTPPGLPQKQCASYNYPQNNRARARSPGSG